MGGGGGNGTVYFDRCILYNNFYGSEKQKKNVFVMHRYKI